MKTMLLLRHEQLLKIEKDIGGLVRVEIVTVEEEASKETLSHLFKKTTFYNLVFYLVTNKHLDMLFSVP
jgi:hypothetical protein